MTFIKSSKLPDTVMPNSLDAALVPFTKKTRVGDTVTIVFKNTEYTMIRNDGRDNKVIGSYFSKTWGMLVRRPENSRMGDKFINGAWKYVEI